MPERLPFRSVSFDPHYFQLKAPTRGGLIQVANIAPDLWAMSYETPPLHLAEADEWKAWLHSLRGGARLFRAVDPVKRLPRAYPNGFAGMERAGAGDFDGTATLAAIAPTLDGVTLSGLPAGFTLALGDLLSFPVPPDGQSLHRVIEAGIAGEGGTLTIGVEPTLPLSAVAEVSVDLADPWCLAVLDAGSVSAPWQLGRRAPVRFAAMQVLTGWAATPPGAIDDLEVIVISGTEVQLNFTPASGA